MNRRTRTPKNHDATTVTPKTPRVHFLPGLANSFLMASRVGTIIENGVELLIEAVYARAYGKHVGRQAWQQCLDLIDKSKIVDMRKQVATKTRTNGRAQTNWTGGVEAGKRAVASPLS